MNLVSFEYVAAQGRDEANLAHRKQRGKLIMREGSVEKGDGRRGANHAVRRIHRRAVFW